MSWVESCCRLSVVCNYLPTFESNDPLRLLGEFDIVGHQDKCGASTGVQVEEQAHDVLTGLGIQIAGWFIGEENARLIDKGAGQGNALLFTPRELDRIMVQAFSQANTMQQLDRERSGLFVTA